MPVLRAPWDAALEVAPDRAAAIDDARRVGSERRPRARRAVGSMRAGKDKRLVHADYESFDDLFRPFTAGTGHSRACYAALDRAGQRRPRAETHRRLGEPNGPFTHTPQRGRCAG
jgi:hypothetical protein